MTEQQSRVFRFCPICERSLVRVECESVVADVCDQHGIFLDHGELAVLERRAIRGVRIGLHASIARDMARPFTEPIPQGDSDGSATGILSSLFSYRVPTNYRPEDHGEPPAPVADRANQDIVPEGMRACPQCHAQMRDDERKDVWGRTETIVIDLCDEHGIWLDHSELAILLDRSNQQARRNARRLRRRRVEAAREDVRRNSGRSFA